MSDKFVGSPAGVVVSQCLLCRNRALGGGFVHCPAFPGGVPDAILTNDFDHRKPHPDEVEPVRFEPRAGADPALVARAFDS